MNDDQQQELDINIGKQPVESRTPDRTETFGERIDRNIKRRSDVPADPSSRTEAQYSEGDDLAEWHLRHKHPTDQGF